MTTIDITINKPLYGTRVYIRYQYIKQAIVEHKKLKITIPQGTAIVDPVRWLTTGTKMEKVFNFPDRPMILYGNDLDIPPKKIKYQEEPIVGGYVTDKGKQLTFINSEVGNCESVSEPPLSKDAET